MTPFVGEIDYFAATKIPSRFWMPCNGQLLQITQFQPLFALIGTTYGGNGTTTFGLPNLQGRVPIGVSGSTYSLGGQGGEETHTLSPAEIPLHQHTLMANATTPASSNVFVPGLQTVLGQSADIQNTNNFVPVYSGANTNTTMAPSSISPAGDTPHENRMPYLAMVACIAVVGIFPPRN